MMHLVRSKNIMWMCDYVRSSSGRLQLLTKCGDEMRVVSENVFNLDDQTSWNATHFMWGAAVIWNSFWMYEEQDLTFI